MADGHKNFSYSTVLTAPSPATSGTSLVLTSGGGALMPTPPFNATIWAAGANPLSSNAEIVRVTAISTDTLTITRSQESSSARTIVTGDQIAATITSKTLTDIENGYLPLAGGTMTGTINATQVITTSPSGSTEQYPLQIIQGSSAPAASLLSKGDTYLGWVATNTSNNRRFTYELDNLGVFTLYMYQASGGGTAFPVWSASVTGGASKFTIGASMFPSNNAGFDLGSPTNYWAYFYATRMYLNSTTYIDGSTAGVAAVTGDLQVVTAGTNAASVATVGGTQSLTNKTFGNTNTAALKTSGFTLQDPTDTTKQAIFDLSANTTGVTRTYPLPNANVMLVNISTAQTLSNKTLTAPIINNPTFSGYGGLSALTADTAALSTTETLLTSITIPTAAVGTTYRITLQGTNTSSVANLSTFTLRAGTLGTTGDASVATATVTSAATGTAVPFRVVIEYTLRTNGATGNGQGMMQLVNNGTTGIAATATAVAALTTSATFATTTATKLDITYKSAAATTTSTFQNAIIEIVKP